MWEVKHVVYRNPLREFWKVQRIDPPHQALLNARSRLKRFRSDASARAACDNLNAAAGVQAPRFKRGDLVQTWFDTGAGKMGGVVLVYGEVIEAGSKAARVLWESGLTNRVTQDSHSIEPAGDADGAREAIAKASR